MIARDLSAFDRWNHVMYVAANGLAGWHKSIATAEKEGLGGDLPYFIGTKKYFACLRRFKI